MRAHLGSARDIHFSVAACTEGDERKEQRGTATYPAVNLELLVQDWLLKGCSLRAGSGGGEAPRRLPEHTRTSGDEGLHGGR